MVYNADENRKKCAKLSWSWDKNLKIKDVLSILNNVDKVMQNELVFSNGSNIPYYQRPNVVTWLL